jgi:hypothetical protein
MASGWYAWKVTFRKSTFLPRTSIGPPGGVLRPQMSRDNPSKSEELLRRPRMERLQT